MIKLNLWANNRLRILVSTYCNIDCFYCHNEGASKQKNEMSVGLFNYIVSIMEYSNSYPTNITFTGGEPLVSDNLEYFIEKVKSNVKYITVITNGILLTEDRLNSLISSGVTKIRLGIDSFLQEKSRPSLYYPVKNFSAFDIVERVKSSKASFELNVVISDYNVDELEWIINYCISNKISTKFFSLLRIEKYGLNDIRGKIYNEALIGSNAFSELIMSRFTNNIKYNIYNNGVDHLFDFGKFTLRYCGYLCPVGMCYMTGTRIDPNGWVYACMERQGQRKIETSDSIQSAINKMTDSIKNKCVSIS